jgi:citrate lyase subunit beta/citryl-CoA lyase
MLNKAPERKADVVVLDLEDGVHPDEKERARDRVRLALDTIDFGATEVFVRVNSRDTSWGEDDLAMVRGADTVPSGVVLPKAEDESEVSKASHKLSGRAPLFLMIETAAGVLRAPRLAAIDVVRGLLFGAADYRESMRAGRSPDETELHFARAQVVHAARAAGIEAFDTPWFAYKDLDGLEASAKRARLMGMDGKTAIHPAQVDIIRRVFTPTEAEVARAREIVAVMEEALSQGRNVAVMGDEMVEALHLKGARRTLARAGESR